MDVVPSLRFVLKFMGAMPIALRNFVHNPSIRIRGGEGYIRLR